MNRLNIHFLNFLQIPQKQKKKVRLHLSFLLKTEIFKLLSLMLIDQKRIR